MKEISIKNGAFELVIGIIVNLFGIYDNKYTKMFTIIIKINMYFNKESELPFSKHLQKSDNLRGDQ